MSNFQLTIIAGSAARKRLASEGWRPELQLQFCVKDILSPERGRLSTPGAIERAPPRLQKFTAWLNAQNA